MDQEVPDEDLPDIPEPPPREHVGPNYHKEDHKLRRAVFLLLILILLAGVGGTYGYLKHRQSQRKAQAALAAQAAKPKVASKIDAATKNYSSPNFYLSFNYPADWTVTDTGGGQMTVMSPPIQLKSSLGQTVTGQIKMLILNTTTNLYGFSKGNAEAMLPSQLINYTNPTQNQRAATYLSFLQYASTDGSGLDAIYITGDIGYQKDQAIPLVDVSKGNPIISVSFAKCSDSVCKAKTTPLTISISSWDDNNFSGPLKNMLKSLSIT